MKCPRCHKKTTSLRITEHGTFCHKCLGVAETYGTRLDDIATRNSFRVRQEQMRYEGDTIPPHRYNPVTKQKEPNPDFIKRFPENAQAHYMPDELRKHKYNKLADRVEYKMKHPMDMNKGVKFRGKHREAVQKAIKNAKHPTKRS